MEGQNNERKTSGLTSSLFAYPAIVTTMLSGRARAQWIEERDRLRRQTRSRPQVPPAMMIERLSHFFSIVVQLHFVVVRPNAEFTGPLVESVRLEL